MRMASSGVSRGRDTSCVERLTLVDQPRPLMVTCSFTTVVCPVNFERCSAVSMRFGANAHCTWHVEVIAAADRAIQITGCVTSDRPRRPQTAKEAFKRLEK